jgi:hypothetical protein
VCACVAAQAAQQQLQRCVLAWHCLARRGNACRWAPCTQVWNYKLRRCLFTLLGHLDYIRTVRVLCACFVWV